MHIIKLSESLLRKRLEHCYDRGHLEAAVFIGNFLDHMQSALLKKEQKKNAGRKFIDELPFFLFMLDF